MAEDLRRHVRRLPLKEAANPSRRERLTNWARRKRPRRLALLIPVIALLACPWLLMREGKNDAALHSDVASRLNHERKVDRALEEATRAIRLDPSDYYGYWARSILLGQREQFEPAFRDMEASLRLARAEEPPLPPETIALLLADRGNLRFGSGNWAEAEKDYLAARACTRTCTRSTWGSARWSWPARSRRRPGPSLTRALQLIPASTPREVKAFGLRLRAETWEPAARAALKEDQLGRARSLYQSAREDLAEARRLLKGLEPSKNEAVFLANDEVLTFMGLGDVEFDARNLPAAKAHWDAASASPEARRRAGPRAPVDPRVAGEPGRPVSANRGGTGSLRGVDPAGRDRPGRRRPAPASAQRAPRVEPAVDLLQPRDLHARIHLRRGDRGCPRISCTTRRSAPPASRWVAKLCLSVWGPIGPAAVSPRARVPVHDPPQAPATGAAPCRETNTSGAGLLLHEMRTVLAQVQGQHLASLSPRGTTLCLSPLPTHRAEPRSQVEVMQPQADDLRGAAARGIEGLQRRAIATAEPRVGAGGREQRAPRPTGRGPSAGGPTRPALQKRAEVLAELPLEHEVAEERREARQVPADAARRKIQPLQILDIPRAVDRRERFEAPGACRLPPSAKPQDIAAIGRQRVRRHAALGHQVVQERADRFSGHAGRPGRGIRRVEGSLPLP